MSRHALRIHDANQGAQSKGQMWGMTGNTPWYLFGAAGLALISVIVGYGVLGLPFLACLLFGGLLVGLALAYVFLLKNNRPGHYDTDFLEAALVEAGLVTFVFGPRFKRPSNPFSSEELSERSHTVNPNHRDREPRKRGMAGAPAGAEENVAEPVASAGASESSGAPASPAASHRTPANRAAKKETLYTQGAYEKLEQELENTREDLEEALCILEEE